MKNPIKVLSLGAGVQSSALLLKYDGLFDFAIFADTQDEPKEVYTWLKKLKDKVKTKIIIATRAKLSEEPDKHNFPTIPLFYINKKTGKKGLGRRFCTKLYKIEVVNKAIRKELGYKKRQRMKHQIQLYLGISIDEEGRVNVPREKWKTHHYPFVEDRINRQDCKRIVYEFMKEFPPRSACTFCPYKKTSEFLELKAKSPEDFEDAVKFDEKIRHLKPGMVQYVHRSMIPLKDLGKKKIENEPEYSFEEMCDGGCGI